MRTLNQLMSLKGRIALVTGACGFLGQAICETLAEQGCDLILLDLPGAKFQDLRDKILNKYEVKVSSLKIDLEDSASRSEAIAKILKENETLSILINTAALVSTTPLEGWIEPFESQSLETWDRALNVNLILDQSMELLLQITQYMSLQVWATQLHMLPPKELWCS
jgi:NAD(P)-dependent dehydrogenase (short-subunit alcohol dehydrogenase family)